MVGRNALRNEFQKFASDCGVLNGSLVVVVHEGQASRAAWDCRLDLPEATTPPGDLEMRQPTQARPIPRSFARQILSGIDGFGFFQGRVQDGSVAYCGCLQRFQIPKPRRRRQRTLLPGTQHQA